MQHWMLLCETVFSNLMQYGIEYKVLSDEISMIGTLEEACVHLNAQLYPICVCDKMATVED